MRMAATGQERRGDWEARYKSAAEELTDLNEAARPGPRGSGEAKHSAPQAAGGTTPDDGLLAFARARADLHETWSRRCSKA